MHLKAETQRATQPVYIYSLKNFDLSKLSNPRQRSNYNVLLFYSKPRGTATLNKEVSAREHFWIHHIPGHLVFNLDTLIDDTGIVIFFNSALLLQSKEHIVRPPFSNRLFNISLGVREFQDALNTVGRVQKTLDRQANQLTNKGFLLQFDFLLNFIMDEKNRLLGHRRESIGPSENFHKLFLELINTNCQETRNVKWYARQLNVSPKYLGNKIKKITGISPKRLICLQLLEKIKSELISTNKSQKCISMEFEMDESTLSNLFKKYTGQTMGSYRSQNLRMVEKGNT